MIQEKDFLYRVPVKNALVATPGVQIRNPEILVDVEGGEFMHGNILDANSTNKLINQSVKDAVDNKLIGSGYVTKDLLEAETSARTKGDEDLSAKIKAEQTRAEGKEKEISDKLAIVDGDSNTEGSFRKAIADVVAAAPEDLDTLKEIADKLAGNDDLHTALNQAITEKADASALLNEVTRATGAESGLQAAIATKADATALSNYVLTTALNKQVDTLNAAISAKQDAGNYIPYIDYNGHGYTVNGELMLGEEFSILSLSNTGITLSGQGGSGFGLSSDAIEINNGETIVNINPVQISSTTNEVNQFKISSTGIILGDEDSPTVSILRGGIKFFGKTSKDIPTASGTFVNYDDFASADDAYSLRINLQGKQDKGNYMEYSSKDDGGYTIDCELNTSEPITIDDKAGHRAFVTVSGIQAEDNNNRKTSQLNASSLTLTTLTNTDVISTRYTIDGIVAQKYTDCLATSDGSFKKISDFVLKEEEGSEYVSYDQFTDQIDSVKAGLSRKQNKITVNSVDTTNLETADITQLRTIVKDLLTALNNSGLIISSSGVE